MTGEYFVYYDISGSLEFFKISDSRLLTYPEKRDLLKLFKCRDYRSFNIKLKLQLVVLGKLVANRLEVLRVEDKYILRIIQYNVPIDTVLR